MVQLTTLIDYYVYTLIRLFYCTLLGLCGVQGTISLTLEENGMTFFNRYVVLWLYHPDVVNVYRASLNLLMPKILILGCQWRKTGVAIDIKAIR